MSTRLTAEALLAGVADLLDRKPEVAGVGTASLLHELAVASC